MEESPLLSELEEEEILPSPTEFALVDEEGILFAVPYSDYTPSYGLGTSNLDIFRGVVYNLPYGQHYVYFRDGQYNYRIAYSRDMELTGHNFYGSDVTVVTYNTYYTSGGQPTFTTSHQSAFSLSAGDYLVYSDLGDYPALTDRGVKDYAQTACIGLAVIFLFSILSRLRSCLRC